MDGTRKRRSLHKSFFFLEGEIIGLHLSSSSGLHTNMMLVKFGYQNNTVLGFIIMLPLILESKNVDCIMFCFIRCLRDNLESQKPEGW